jgi:hypothetical protein
MNSMSEAVEIASESFVPLERSTGTFVRDFMRLHTGRDLVVWGAGVLGRCLMHQLRPYTASGQMLAFTDSNSRLAGTMIDGQPVLDFDEVMRRASDGNTFLLLALAGHTRTGMTRLAGAGLTAGVDYESYLKLSRPETVIQISGVDGGRVIHMAADTCRAILAKLKADIPDLFHVDLSGLGDPLDHPAIDVIVAATRAFVPCTLTTRLDAGPAVIERALLAAPTQFVVAVDSDRDEAFFDRLRLVADLQDRLAGHTEIRVKYTCFRDNGAGFDALREHCDDLGLKLVETIGYIDPYDTTLRLCKAGDLDVAEATRLTWSLRDALDLARVDRARPCLCQRIFPVINPDGSVGVCHLYAQPRVHNDYLAVDYDTLQNLRHHAAHCRVCQHYALHRLDVDVLQARHAIRLIPTPETAHA